MQAAHPAKDVLYTVTTRAVSSALKQGKIGDASIVLSIEVIQTENTAGQKKSSAKKGDVTFQKQSNGTYLVSGVTWTDIVL